MKTRKFLTPIVSNSRQGGAVLIVVISLLATLIVLGLFFFSWTSQELANARYFADEDPVEIEPTRVFDFGLRQVLVSVPAGYENSALYADPDGTPMTFHSLLAHQIGPIDVNGRPLRGGISDGRGILVNGDINNDNVLDSGDETIDLDGDMAADYPGFEVDYNGDGTVDSTDQIILNLSSAANGGTPLSGAQYVMNPDVGYTYPGQNSLFLAMDYTDPASGIRMIKPSFTLPGYLPVHRYGTNGFSDIYRTSAPMLERIAGNQTMRPHESHVSATGVDRYITTSTVALSGDRNRILEPFPMDGGTWGFWEDRTGGTAYNLGKDLDGDGIDDAVAIDHDHPIIDLPGGRQVAPIYYWKVIDLDGLLNANVHGNQSFAQARSNISEADLFTDVFQSTDWASYSHFGLSPSEVNLSIGLSADPQSGNYIASGLRDYVTAPHRGYVAERHDGMGPVTTSDRSGGSGSITRLQMANIETSMMMFGRPDIIPDQTDVNHHLDFEGVVDHVGRYGSDGDLRLALIEGGFVTGSGQLPAPGVRGTDENRNDGNVGNDGTLALSTHQKGGRAFVDTRLNVAVPPFVHPLDYSGLGDTSIANGAKYRRTVTGPLQSRGETFLGSSLTNNPVRWSQYPTAGVWQNMGANGSTVLGGGGTYGSFEFRTYRDTTGLLTSTADFLLNDPSESHPYSAIPNSDDAMFSPSEIAGLHLGQSDWSQGGMGSRLRELMPFNFEWNYQADEIRKRFTTESWDRTEFSVSRAIGNRNWEFNNTNKFPPRFGGVAASMHEETDPNNTAGTYTTANISINDPFRPEVRRLLTVDPSVAVPDRTKFPQMRLQLNKILSDDVMFSSPENPDHAAFDSSGNPYFRNLVPHTLLAAGGTIEPMVHDHYTQAGVLALAATHPLRNFQNLSGDALVQEWWARYDRQRLARDIYVLLYTLGRGNDAFDLSAGVPTLVDSNGDGVDDFTYDCAQFAVNYVDAMDRDNVITRFEFDTNLSDGWQSTGHETVYGIEEQSLSFSEVLCIETQSAAADSSVTLFDESNDNHRFLYMELRNNSPFAVDLDDESWRIVRLNIGTGVEEIAATFTANGGTPKQVPPGENYHIACHDGFVVNGAGDPIGSEFYVDSDSADASLECIVPKGGVTDAADNQAVPPNVIDLDLSSVNVGTTSDDNFGAFSAIAPYTGTSLVERTTGGSMTVGPNFVLSLQRRQNLEARGTGEDVWLEVDRIEVEVEFFHEATSATQIQTELNNIQSRERKHSFSLQVDEHPGVATQNHSMDIRATHKHRANDYLIANLPSKVNSAGEFNLWQPHFDRDMTSVVDLLSVPMYGWQDMTTDRIYDTAPKREFYGGTVQNLVDDWRLTGHRTAQTRFLYPDPADLPANHAWTGHMPAHGNRWYRLLNFVEVDPVADDAVDDRLALNRRIPGRINLNTLRHEHVLAGIVDDDIHHNAIANRDHPAIDRLNNTRNWFNELLATRDQGYDPSADTVITDAPGTPFSRPFRALSDFDRFDADGAIQNTILRRGFGPGKFNEASLFEARPVEDFDGNGGHDDDDLVDYHTRNRLLAKVANQTTTKSHVFAIWVGFDLHEAHTHSSGAVQIGARATDLPTYRQFLVVDMSRLEEAYNPETGSFDFRKFIIHQQMLP